MIIAPRLRPTRSGLVFIASIGAVIAWDVAVTVVFFNRPDWFTRGEFPFALFGSAIALFIGVAINAAYSRWWEARTLWGQVVNSSRSLGRQAITTIADPDMVATVVRGQIAYVHALRATLREQEAAPAIERHLGTPSPEQDLPATPTALLSRTGELVAAAAQAGRITELARVQLESTLVVLTDAQGGLERIKNTPLPVQYRTLPAFFARTFCLLLPFAVVNQLGWFTPVGSALVSFMFLITVKAGRDLAEPFTDGVHDVPMTTLCRTIEIDLLRLLNEEVPSKLTPVDRVLW